MINNGDEVLEFFSSIIELIRQITQTKNKRKVFIDISKVEGLTIDAVIYLIVIIRNLTAKRDNVRFFGNLPESEDAKNLMLASGFDKFVKFKYNDFKTVELEKDLIKITSGDENNPTEAGNIIDFICRKSGRTPVAYRPIYKMLIELMANAKEHAYNNSMMLPSWYCFVKCEEDFADFIFLDTGLGIPKTLRKNFFERIKLFNSPSESFLVASALDGEFRTQTGKKYRGRGLPDIMNNQIQKRISNLTIISNRARIEIIDGIRHEKDIRYPLVGTLFFWKVQIR